MRHARHVWLAALLIGVPGCADEEPVGKADTVCSLAERTCTVHVVRGAPPQTSGEQCRGYLLRMGPERDKTVQVEERPGKGYRGAFAKGSGLSGRLRVVEVTSRDASVVITCPT